MKHASGEAAITTLHGPDGCGKSMIAGMVHDIQSASGQHGNVLIIGSSEFRNWLSADIYREFVGSTDRLEAGTGQNASPEAKTLLYEDIAVCLFGLARRHANTEGSVIVHSDPYLKRLVWARNAKDDDAFWQYADYFDDYVGSRIGDTFATHAVDLRACAADTFDRLHTRGLVSEYDPSTLDENERLVSAVSFVSERLLGAQRPYPRLQSVQVIPIDNPTKAPEELNEHLYLVASHISQFSEVA